MEEKKTPSKTEDKTPPIQDEKPLEVEWEITPKKPEEKKEVEEPQKDASPKKKSNPIKKDTDKDDGQITLF